MMIANTLKFGISSLCVQVSAHVSKPGSAYSRYVGLPWSGKIIWKMYIFQIREKSGNFVVGLGNLKRTWKVREKSGNSKTNGYGRQSPENLFLLFKRGKDVLSHEII